ncbi:MAG TPA: hypothetical protein VF532_13020 [Candidatus Angelobacter sp.]
MEKHRKLLIIAILAGSAVAVALFLWQRTARIPQAARLLPEGDIVLYANLKPVRLFDSNQSRPVQPEGDYRDFVEQTGIQFERDLDEVAISRKDTTDGTDTESSEVFVGRFNQQRLRSYLEKISTEKSDYRDHTIFTVPHEGHTVRVSILDEQRVAVTNMQSPQPIRGMIDAWFKPPAGTRLLREHYRRVPVTALGWMVARIPAGSKVPQLPFGLSFDFLENTVAVASVRYQGDVLLQADVIARSDADAKRIADDASSFLMLSRGAAQALRLRGADPDVKAAFDSIQVQQNKNVAVFTATLSQRFLKKVISDVQAEASTPPTTPSPVSKPRAGPRRRR